MVRTWIWCVSSGGVVGRRYRVYDVEFYCEDLGNKGALVSVAVGTRYVLQVKRKLFGD